MMKYPFYAMLLLLACGTIISCRKSKDNSTPTPVIDPPVVVYDDYMKMKPGNYWIYQDYQLDSVNGAAHPLGTYDSAYVEKDTVVNGKSYHKYWDKASGGAYSYSLMADSLSYEVSDAGRILFSSTNFVTVFRSFNYGPNVATPDTLKVTEQMGFKDSTITVEAGTFKTSSFRQVYHNPVGSAKDIAGEYDHRYCKNIGLISYTTGFYSLNPVVLERRLVRFHVQIQ